MHYSYDKMRDACVKAGLQFDETNLAKADQAFKLNKFTQKQVDAAVGIHIHEVKRLFTPQSYSLGQRIKIALYFLVG